MVSRRRVLTATAGIALGTLAPVMPVLAAAAQDPRARSIPRTISARRTLTNGHLYVPAAAFQLTHLGVTWQDAHALIRLRTKAGWTPWQAISGCGAEPDRREPTGGSALLIVPQTVGYDLRVEGTGTAQITELNTVDGPAMPAAAAVESGMPLPDGTVLPVPYLSRAAWGADESQRFRTGVEYWPPEIYPTQTLTVHHTAGANDDPDPAATIRAIYYYQAMPPQDWGDIGYHLLIDEAGRVYEGRWSGPDPYPVFDAVLGADRRPSMSTGAHVGGFNTGNIGVCLLGNFTDRQPTAAALDALTTVLAGLARVNGLDPRGTTNYVNPVNGMTRTVRTISGHRDWAATQCPGNTFYPQLPALRDSVAARIPTFPLSIWDGSASPSVPAQPDPDAVEVGVKFRSDVAGQVTGVRFYKASGSTGTHVGHLWSTTGQLLGTVTFTGESATGWQQANFATPVPITAGATYVVSYYAPNGHYAFNTSYFATTGVDHAPLHALRNGVDGPNGLYRYGTGGGFPNSSWQSSNYWVDVMFSAG